MGLMASTFPAEKFAFSQGEVNNLDCTSRSLPPEEALNYSV